SIALEPRMGIELRPALVDAKGARGKRKRKVKGRNRISGGLYLMPSIGVAQISSSNGTGVQQNTELLVGSTLQLSVWID
ncbi:MAG: hypothetical protein VX278_20785, partial [Myxococcota bacterium]|nr:hypothetical protein [Myxococcota bacterium]